MEDRESLGNKPEARVHCSRVLQVPELLDYIIDFLKGKIPLLKTCSLVSQAWSISAARHLFSTILINPELPHHRIQATDNDEDDITDTDAFELSYTWLITRPRVINNVRTISIYIWEATEQATSGARCISYTFVFDTLSRFHRLRSLSILADGPLHVSPLSPSHCTTASLLKLETLAIDCSRDEVEQIPMREMLACVHEVRNLVLVGMDYEACLRSLVEEKNGGAAIAPTTKVTKSIKPTLVSTKNVVAMCRMLASIFDISDATSIVFEESWPKGAFPYDTFNTFTQEHVPNLEHLRFCSDTIRSLVLFGWNVDSGVRFDLSRIPVPPRSIELTLQLNYPGRQLEPRLWNNFMRILLSAPPGSLLHISISLSFTIQELSLWKAMWILANLNWDLLDSIVDRQASLRTLKIHFSAHSPLAFGELEDFVREKISSRVSQVVSFSHSWGAMCRASYELNILFPLSSIRFV